MEQAAISLTTGLEDPERATVAFLVAVGAAESGRPTIMFLTKGSRSPGRPGARPGGVTGAHRWTPSWQRYAAAGRHDDRLRNLRGCQGNRRRPSSTTRPRRAQSELWSGSATRCDDLQLQRAAPCSSITTAPEDAAGGLQEVHGAAAPGVGFLPRLRRLLRRSPERGTAWAHLSPDEWPLRCPNAAASLVTIAAARACKSSYCAVATRPSPRQRRRRRSAVPCGGPNRSTLDVVDAAVFRFAAATASDPAIDPAGRTSMGWSARAD